MPGERHVQIGEITGGAVYQQDHAAFIGVGRGLDHVDEAAADVDPLPHGGISGLDPPREQKR